MAGPRYKREGECKRCGWCCRNEECEHFIVGTPSTCAIFGREDRPIKCVVYPSGPPILNKDCGFYFLDTWNDEKVTKGVVWR